MTIAIPQDKPLIAIYACGGAGYNLAKSFTQEFMKSNVLSDRVKIYYVDTSTSNDNEFNNTANTMVIGSGSGSGKKRGVNAEDIREACPSVLQAFKPGVFNINLGGTSGGSGSTIVNEMFRLLAMRDQNVINVLVGSRASRTEIENTHKTFVSFDRLAKRLNVPALVHYRENSSTVPRSQTNKNLINNLGILCLFLSGQDDKMDITDIHHLLNFHKVTDFKPVVAGFELFLDKFEPRPHEVLYAAGSLAREDVSTDIDPPPVYQVAGHANEVLDAALVNVNVLHWTVLGNSFTPLIDELGKKVAEFEKVAMTHIQDRLDRNSSDEDDDILV